MEPVSLAYLLIAAGLLLLLTELLFPSGICFALAVCAIVGGVAITFIYSPDPYVGWLTLLVVFVVVPLVLHVVVRFWRKTSMGKRFFLESPEEDATVASLPVNLELGRLRGRVGRAVSDLRPSGVSDFDGWRVDTITEGMMVEAGQWVRCIDVKAGKVIVRPVDKPNLGDLESADFS